MTKSPSWKMREVFVLIMIFQVIRRVLSLTNTVLLPHERNEDTFLNNNIPPLASDLNSVRRVKVIVVQYAGVKRFKDILAKKKKGIMVEH